MTRLYNWHRGVGDAGRGVRAPLQRPRAPGSRRPGGRRHQDRRRATSRCSRNGREPRRPAVSAIAYDAKGQRDAAAPRQRHRDALRLRPRDLPAAADPDDAAGISARSRFPLEPGDDAVVQQLLYTYDPSGNITEVEDQAYEPVFFRNQIVEPRSTYTYDALYRLIEATGRENATASGPPPQRPEPGAAR